MHFFAVVMPGPLGFFAMLASQPFTRTREVEEQAVPRALVHHEPLDAAQDVGPRGPVVGVALVVCQHNNAAGCPEAKAVLQAVLDALCVCGGGGVGGQATGMHACMQAVVDALRVCGC